MEKIRDSKYYIPELSFVAEIDGKIVGHFIFSRFPLSSTPNETHIDNMWDYNIVMLTPVAVHADCLHQGIGSAMITQGIEKVRNAGYKEITVEGGTIIYTIVLALRRPQSSILSQQAEYQ